MNGALVVRGYVLQVVCPGQDTQTIMVEAPLLVLGADHDVDLRLSDPAISARHAELLFRDGLLGVRDLGSTNGTWIGQRRVSRSLLRPGRTFRLGHTHLTVLEIEGMGLVEDPPTMVRSVSSASPEHQVNLSACFGAGAAPAEPVAALPSAPTSPPRPCDLPVLYEAPPLGERTVAWHNSRIFDLCAAIGASTDLRAVASLIEDVTAELTGATRVHLLYYDSESGQLWSESDPNKREATHDQGLVGVVARTGSALRVERVDVDRRYLREADDPNGSGDESLLAEPVRGGPTPRVEAVLTIVRVERQGQFGVREQHTLENVAREIGPILHRIGLAQDAARKLAALAGRGNALFRAEAVQAREEAFEAEVLQISPAWTRVSYWVLIAVLVVGVLGLFVGRIGQYSVGPAYIRQVGRSDVLASSAGTIQTAFVRPGLTVRAGQPLVQLDNSAEVAEFRAARNEFEAQVRNRLIDPGDETAAQAVRGLRLQVEAAATRLDQRLVRAPHEGVVGDVAVEVGQRVEPGAVVASMAELGSSDLEVVAFLPGGHLPQLEPGSELLFELSKYQYVYQRAEVSAVGDSVIGPSEAKKLLGPKLVDAIELNGPVVLVRAKLTTHTFESDGQRFDYHPGMNGTAEVRLADESLIELLIPAFKEL